jgi:two-component system sensor histidine kinase BaeS
MRRRTLRARLLAALLLVALGVLVMAGSTTYVLVEDTASDEALDDLREKADEVLRQSAAVRTAVERAGAPDTEREDLRAFLVQVQRLLRLANARLVFVARDGRLLEASDLGTLAPVLVGGDERLLELPDPLEPDDVDATALAAGETVDGRVGSTVFVARPVTVLEGRGRARGVLVLTQDARTDPVGRAGPRFLVAALLALAASAGISVWLARRMTEPLRRVQATAASLAAGDLSARVVLPAGAADELATLAATLDTMAAELEQARGAERAFLLSVSHDLRTPLTSIRGYADALADGTIDAGDPEARLRAASIIGAEARRLERLVRDLLELARLDARAFDLHPRSCDAAAVVREAAEAFRPQADALGVELAVETSSAPVPAVLDPERLAQVVANLVENALQHTERRIVVTVATTGPASGVLPPETAPETLEIAVSDDGPGIAAEDAQRVFERLSTSRGGAGRAVGTGLGLAIVRELVTAMGGTARVEPVGRGARLVVTVPLPAPRHAPRAR